MASDIAALNIKVDSSQMKQATAELKTFVSGATAAEKAAQRWGASNENAARSTEDFSRRVQGTIKQLEFERQQMARSSSEREKYATLKRAGVSAASAEGRAISASVAALQAQRAAVKDAGEAHGIAARSIKVAGTAANELVSHLKFLALAYLSVEGARKLWEIAMNAGDLGEQAEQVGVSTDQLQAYRLAAAQAGIETEQMDVALTKLAKSMGTANDGNKEMIERFQELGVKLLDAKGELRPVADVLPEVARGILGIESSSKRTAVLMDLFGKSGAKMATVLKDIAEGNDAVIATARQKNAIISPETIAAWDNLGDHLKVAGVQFAAFVAQLGAPIATKGLDLLIWKAGILKAAFAGIASLPSSISNALTNSSTMELSTRQDTLRAQLDNIKDSTDALDVAKVSQIKRDLADISDTLANRATILMPAVTVTGDKPSVGVGNPAAKATGGSDPYKKAIESAKEYTALKKVETEAIGENVNVAARLKHEQELINKASEDANKLTPVQVANLKSLAAEMANADAKFATAKFMDEAKTKSEEFVAEQQIERDTLWMSAQAAEAYKISQTLLNEAKAKGIDLSAADVAKLKEQADAQAASAQATRDAKELYDLAKESFSGFISDMRQGLMEGKSVWETFGIAASNALDKIASKLLDMAAQKLFESAFGGASGGGGGLLGSLISSVVGGASGGLGGGSGITFAKGAAFDRGNVVKFASGGRMGLAGEAGPEAVVPLSRGSGGRLGVSMQGGTQRVEIVLVDDMLDARIADGSNVQIVRATPNIVKTANKAVPSLVAQDHRDSGGDYRTRSS